MPNRYFLKDDRDMGEGREVTKEEWIAAERGCGFRPKMSSDHPDYHTTCATSGFGSGRISGRIEYGDDGDDFTAGSDGHIDDDFGVLPGPGNR